MAATAPDTRASGQYRYMLPFMTCVSVTRGLLPTFTPPLTVCEMDGNAGELYLADGPRQPESMKQKLMASSRISSPMGL